MTDTKMLDWFENNAEKAYPIQRGKKSRHILVWTKGDNDNLDLHITEGDSLRDCIERAAKGEGRAL